MVIRDLISELNKFIRIRSILCSEHLESFSIVKYAIVCYLTEKINVFF